MIVKNKFFYVVLLALLYVNCTKNDDDAPTVKQTWHSKANGYVLEQNGNDYKLYGTSIYGCTLIDDHFKSDNYANIRFDLVGDKIIASSELLTGHLVFDEISDANSACDFDSVLSTEDPLINFNYLWNVFNDYYAFFDQREVNWDDYMQLSSTVNENNLYSVFDSMITPLKDGHVSIVNGSININSNRQNLLEKINSNLSEDFIIPTTEALIGTLNERISFINANYLGSSLSSHVSGNMVWGLLNDDVGYVNLISMEGYASEIDLELTTVSELMNVIMSDVQENNINKLIIDLRFNTGGYDGVALDIASRFITDSRPVFSKKSKLGDNYTEEQVIVLDPKGSYQFEGEIVLLTSAITASAAEVFILCLKDLPNVTIVGQNTNGVFSDILTHRLPNGTFIGLSNQIYADVGGNIYEAIGIGPAVENKIPFLSTFDFSNATDSAIERGLDLLD